MFDLDTLKDKLDGETLAKLRTHVDDITGQRDAARTESIDGRKALKARVAELQTLSDRALAKLGIDSAEELEALPEAKGQGEALKQYEAKLKRAERERDEAVQTRDGLTQQMSTAKRAAAIAQAVGAVGFHRNDEAEAMLAPSIEQQDNDYMFKTKDGKFIPLADGVRLLAAERPHMVKAPQGTGSGFRDGGGQAKVMTQAAFDGLKPGERASAMADGFTLTQN